MNQETTQIVADIIKTINNPSNVKYNWQTLQLIEYVEKLCQMRINQNLFQFDGFTYCSICQEFLNQENFKQLPCQHNVHVGCFQGAMLSQSQQLQVIELQYCCQPDCRNQRITEELLIDFFGYQQISTLREEYQLIYSRQTKKQALQQMPSCQVCKDILGQNFKQLFCGHFIHIECFQNYMFSLSPKLDIEDLRYKYCCEEQDFCRSQIVTDQMLFEFFGQDNVLLIRQKYEQNEQEVVQQILKTQKEEEEKTCCTICKLIIENEKLNTLACGHAIHKSCFRGTMMKQSPGLILNELKVCCQYEPKCFNLEINEELLLNYFDKDELAQIRDDFQANMLFIQQLKEQELLEIRNREKAANFTCNICFDEYNIETDAITLKCNHRFCQNCLKENISALVEQGKFLNKDIACPECGKSIDPDILKYCVPGIFDKIVELRMANLVMATQVKGEKVVNCPARGCGLPFYIPENMPFPQCPTCKLEFCANGCETKHEGIKCEDYLMKVKANQKQGETKCPKCKVPIFKDGGCNHITCKCKHEFCFVCQGPYKPKKTCKCPQNGTTDNVLGFLRYLNPFR